MSDIRDARSALQSSEDYQGGNGTQDNTIDTGPSLLDYNVFKPSDSLLASTSVMDTEPLADLIRAHMIQAEGKENIQFLPIDQLKKIITSENVFQELQRVKVQGDSLSIVRNVCEMLRRKIFAILCLMDKAAEIEAFIKDGLSDDDLPFTFKSSSGVDVYCEMKTGLARSVSLFQSAAWRSHDREIFNRYQWQLLAPSLSFGEDYHFKDEEILPFMEIANTHTDGGSSGSLPREGGFSLVRKVKIHPAHMSAYQDTQMSPDSYFALKQVTANKESRQTYEEAFRREVEALKRISHTHTIKLLATYKFNGRYHMIFPLADGNLKDFWMTTSVEHSRPTMDLDTERWLSKQCLGLVLGLQSIHQSKIDKSKWQEMSLQDRQKTYGRHGDLKPENILWFKSGDSATGSAPTGTLKIADFGFADFHSSQSTSNVRTSAISGFTDTYKAPEFDVTKRVSLSYDIWSLGCVLLELAVWYLHGWEGVEEFSKKREADSNGVIGSSAFYKLNVNADNRLFALIKPSVIEEINLLKLDPACSDYIFLLLEIIQKRMLLVKPEKRANIQACVESMEKLLEYCQEHAVCSTARVDSARRIGPSSSPTVELESIDSQSSNEDSVEDYTPLYDLYNRVLESVDDALDEDVGCAWNDTNIVTQLHNVSMHLKHWKDSIHWILIKADTSKAEADTEKSIAGFLESLEDHDPFLSGMIRSYMEDVVETLSEIRALHTDGPRQHTNSLLSITLRKDIDTAVQCLGQQLIPLRAFAESTTPPEDRVDFTSAIQVNTFEVPELLSDDVEEELPENTADLLRSSQVQGQELEQVFLPLKALEEILTEERIEMELEEYRTRDPIRFMKSELKSCAHLIRAQYLKTFAILILLDKGQEIGNFIEEGVNDKDLPFIGNQKGGLTDLARSEAPDDPLGCFKTWKAHQRESFLYYQRRIDVPYLDFDVITSSVRHADFAAHTILPFLEIGEFGRSYSSITKVKIHPACHGFRNILKKIQTNDNFAIKQFRTNHEDYVERAFWEEVEMLKPLSRTHNHLVSLLMTWSYRGNYYLLFPWAECDLANFWIDTSHTPLWDPQSNQIDLDTVRWMSEQIHGMADGLDSIHHPRRTSDIKFGRHGDLKPENILWFKDPHGGRGTLVISDFGSSALHTVCSRSNIPADEVSMTPTYRPPEYDLKGGKASRASDIWSFGCVLLEFVCWALGGGDLVQSFAERRTSPYLTGSYSDVFFEAKAIPDERYVIKVKRQVSTLIFELHQNKYCTGYFHDLLDIIENDMVVVLSQDSQRLSSTELLNKLTGLHLQVIGNKDYCQRSCPEDRPLKLRANVEVVLNVILLKRARERLLSIWARSTDAFDMSDINHRSTMNDSSHSLESVELILRGQIGTSNLLSVEVSPGPDQAFNSGEAAYAIVSGRPTMNSFTSYASRLSHTMQHRERPYQVQSRHATHHMRPRHRTHPARPRHATHGPGWIGNV